MAATVNGSVDSYYRIAYVIYVPIYTYRVHTYTAAETGKPHINHKKYKRRFYNMLWCARARLSYVFKHVLSIKTVFDRNGSSRCRLEGVAENNRPAIVAMTSIRCIAIIFICTNDYSYAATNPARFAVSLYLAYSHWRSYIVLVMYTLLYIHNIIVITFYIKYTLLLPQSSLLWKRFRIKKRCATAYLLYLHDSHFNEVYKFYFIIRITSTSYCVLNYSVIFCIHYFV